MHICSQSVDIFSNWSRSYTWQIFSFRDL